jgi:hypothetical protein
VDPDGTVGVGDGTAADGRGVEELGGARAGGAEQGPAASLGHGRGANPVLVEQAGPGRRRPGERTPTLVGLLEGIRLLPTVEAR